MRERFVTTLHLLRSYLKKLPLSGAVRLIIWKLLFVEAALLLGFWIALSFTFPKGLILSPINKILFKNDMGLNADNVGYSFFKTISLDNGEVTKRGKTVFTFNTISYTPSLGGILAADGSGTVSVVGINGDDNELEASFSLGDYPCYEGFADNVPLDFLPRLLSAPDDMSLRGYLSGDMKFCFVKPKEKAKTKTRHRRSSVPKKDISSTFSFEISRVFFKGKIPTGMGDMNVGRVSLGNIVLKGTIDKRELTFDTFTIKGMFEVTVTGVIRIDKRYPGRSRLDLQVKLFVKDLAALNKNKALVTVLSLLSRYEDREHKHTYFFSLRGSLSSPTMHRARKINRSHRKKRR